METGTRIGSYEITGSVGAGGMGAVYRAHDARLGRDVAIKVLPAELVANAEGLRRFEREARATAALSHPNILAIFDVGTHEGAPYLVEELVAGESLRQRLARGPLPLRQAVEIAAQLARGLAAAHEKGIVHRDLKPDNVIVTPDGIAKILDFGVAKLLDLRAPGAVETAAQAPTAMTVAGQAIGTAAYMAPEQARGARVDHRADVFSLGVVLHEMLAGTRPFAGASAADAIAAILKDDPAPLPASVPAELAALVRHCLEKRPEDRFQSARDLAFGLESAGAAALRQRTATAAVETVVQRPPAATAAPPRARRWWRGAALAALAVAAAATAALLWRGPGPAPQGGATAIPPITSLAVLPLANLTGDPAQEYFVGGMQEAVITELSKIAALKVISRTSTLRYTDTRQSLPEVAKALGVDGIVEGSVQRDGNQVRITVQLIHAPTDRHLWAHSFDRELAGILALHSEVARAIAAEIRVQVTPQEQARLAATRTVDPRAYELYVLGRHFLNQRTIPQVRQAVDYLDQAIARDPLYAPAHVVRGGAIIWLGEQIPLPVEEARARSAQAISEALRLDDGLAEAHVAQGWWRSRYEFDWVEAERDFRRGIELNPGDASAYVYYARLLAILGRRDEAVAANRKGLELDPLSLVNRTYAGIDHIFLREYDQATAHLREALTLDPDYAMAHHVLGEVLIAQGRPAEAAVALERANTLAGEPGSHFRAMLGLAYIRAGRTAEARAILGELERSTERHVARGFDLAVLLHAVGRSQEAVTALEHAVERRESFANEITAWPWFESLHGDPRFQALVRRLGVPQ